MDIHSKRGNAAADRQKKGDIQYKHIVSMVSKIEILKAAAIHHGKMYIETGLW